MTLLHLGFYVLIVHFLRHYVHLFPIHAFGQATATFAACAVVWAIVVATVLKFAT